MTAIIDELSKISGEKYVSDKPHVLLSYSRDASPYFGEMPSFVVRPGSVQEISEILLLANKQHTPVTLRGGGTSLTKAAVPLIKGSISMDLTRLKGFTVDIDSLSVTAAAGVTWGELNMELFKLGWHTGFTGPESGSAATIAGSASVSSVGHQAAKFGTISDNVLGLQVILPKGGDKILETGSRVNPSAKRHCRYGLGPDSTGIFLGDQGIFGVKTQISLRLYKKPEFKTHFTYSFPKIDRVISFLHRLSAMKLTTDLHFFEQGSINALAAGTGKFDLMGTKYLIAGSVEGYSQAEVDAIMEIIENVRKELKGKEKNAEILSKIWTDYNFTFYPLVMGTLGSGVCASCHKLPIPDIALALKEFEKFKQKYADPDISYSLTGFIADNTFDFLIQMHYDAKDTQAWKKAQELFKKKIELELSYGGVHYWLGDAIAKPLFQIYPKQYQQFLINLKNLLDPNRILNPGLLIPYDK